MRDASHTAFLFRTDKTRALELESNIHPINNNVYAYQIVPRFRGFFQKKLFAFDKRRQRIEGGFGLGETAEKEGIGVK